MPLILRFAARSDVGRIRSKNDDSAYVGRHLAVVADGMGGHVGGDVASASTVLDLAPLDLGDHGAPDTVLPDEIQNANLILNDLVHANPKLAGMGTTCTAVLLSPEGLHLAHIGDSRAYRLKDGQFSQVTRDHTFVQRLVDEGRLRAEDAESHPHKNVLMRVLGDVDASPELDIRTLEAAPGERWLLCSDGLTAVVPPPVIASALREGEDLQQIVDSLVELTLAGGAPDNVTVVVFDVVEDTADEAADTAPSAAPDAAASSPDHGPDSASLLREDLQGRPHVLVGAASLATQTGKIPIVTRHSTERRAAALLTGASPMGAQGRSSTAALAGTGAATAAPAGPAPTTAPRDTAEIDTPEGRAGHPHPTQDTTPDGDHDTGAEPDAPPGASPAGRRRRSLFIPIFTALLALIFAAVLTWAYLWTQTQYYVGVDQDRVAIYNGVSQQIGPITLSHVDQQTDIPVDRLPTYSRQRVVSGLPARDLEHAQEIVTELENTQVPAAPHVSPSPSPTAPSTPPSSPPQPSPSGSVQPTGTATPSAAARGGLLREEDRHGL